MTQTIEVFIQAAAGSVEKQVLDERTLEYRSTFVVPLPYPFPYGFVIGTSTEDGDCIDCYVISKRPLATGSTVRCTPVALLEQLENGEVDHKILAVLPDDAEELPLDQAIETLREFILGIFAHFPGVTVALGRVHDAASASAFITTSRTSRATS